MYFILYIEINASMDVVVLLTALAPDVRSVAKRLNYYWGEDALI